MPRLERSNLAKEFSDVVKQEIKNHNDSILATNVSLNEMRNSLEIAQHFSSTEHLKFNAMFIAHQTALNIISEEFKSKIAKLQRESNDRSAQAKADLASVRKAFDDRLTYFMTIDGFDYFSKKIDQWSANIQRSFEVQNDVMRQRCDRILDETKQAIEILRGAVQKSIDQEIEDRKDQDVTLDHFAVNFAGMQQEIEKTKKRCFIIEKNIENLYTQIERLKEAK
jgi:hypothetical protein